MQFIEGSEDTGTHSDDEVVELAEGLRETDAIGDDSLLLEQVMSVRFCCIKLDFSGVLTIFDIVNTYLELVSLHSSSSNVSWLVEVEDKKYSVIRKN